MKKRWKNYLYIFYCFLYESSQVSVCACTGGGRVTSPVLSEVTDHQVEVVPLQLSKPEGLADRADLGQTHPSLLELRSLLFQPSDT